MPFRATWNAVQYHGAQRRDYTPYVGMELHNAVELGEPFEQLIDHPAWINYVRHYAGEEDSYVQGLFIDECLISIRNSGGYFALHSGGYQGALRGRYQYAHNVFRCGQCNVLMALTDLGPGDGATLVIPGSHKANFAHPHKGPVYSAEGAVLMEGAIEVHLKRGDVLLFVDGLMHGAANRTNPGERRVVIYRYGPPWANTRFGYTYSPELLARLTPERRKILQPIRPCPNGSDFVPRDIGEGVDVIY